MNEPSYVKMMAQAEILESVAAWADQPDEPTGRRGVLLSDDLRMRAIALRVQAEVLTDGAEA